MINGIEIIRQFPALTAEDMISIETRLENQFGYSRIPEDYKALLRQTNGCRFNVDDDYECVALPVNLPFMELANVAGIFGVWCAAYEGLPGTHPEWPELFASNQNSKENFNVLPQQMMSFAYEDESSASLFAMSVAHEDFGRVYYYYDDYLYRLFGRPRMLDAHGYCYYDRKIQGILTKHGINLAEVKHWQDKGHLDSVEIINNVEELSARCVFDLQRVKFIPIADSFNEFLSKLTLQSC